MSKDLLLFLAVLPGEEVQAEVTAFKKYALEHYQSGRALRSPPHITLIPPFRWAPERLRELYTCLQRFAQPYKAFDLALHDFDCFRPRVIFVDVADSEDLRLLQSSVELELKSELNIKTDRTHSFHPHMTIAFKDLRSSVFPDAWNYFSQKEYRRVFSVREYCLLEHHGREWRVKRRFVFGE